MAKKSAGLLLYRYKAQQLEVLLIHPGGPFWAKKDHGAWSIPKGEFDDNESPQDAAIRETEEEIGKRVDSELLALTPRRMKSGKLIHAFAAEEDFDPSTLKSNMVEIEWPHNSGKMHTFPEVDKAEWFDIKASKEKIHQGQVPFIEELEEKLR